MPKLEEAEMRMNKNKKNNLNAQRRLPDKVEKTLTKILNDKNEFFVVNSVATKFNAKQSKSLSIFITFKIAELYQH